MVHGSARRRRLPVTQEMIGSNPVWIAKIANSKLIINFYIGKVKIKQSVNFKYATVGGYETYKDQKGVKHASRPL